MDGREADSFPSPDPQVILQKLLRQAQTGSHPQHDSSPASSDDEEDHSSASSAGTDAEESDGVDDQVPSLQPSAAPTGSYDQLSITLSRLTADRRELSTLLSARRHLTAAQRRNSTHIRALEKSQQLLLKTRDELKSALNSLDIADIVDAEDQSLEVIRTHRYTEDAASISPFAANMVYQIPLLRLQSIERAEYDNALGSRVWLEVEDRQLRAAVKAAALKQHTVALAMDPKFKGDPLAEAAKLDEVSALRLAEEIEDSKQPQRGFGSGRGDQGLDWATIAGRIPSRSIEELRTRWNGVIKPSVNKAHLARGTQQSSSSVSEAPVPWQKVARELGTDRTGYACFVAYCSAIVARDQPDFTAEEDEEIKELFSLFRGAWRFIALHSSAGLNLSLPSSSSTATGTPRPASLLGKIAREAQLVYRRFRNTTDPALATGKWWPVEDALLIEAVRAVGQDNWAAVAARVPGRTSSQCRERWVRRLKQVVEDANAVAAENQGDREALDVERLAEMVKSKKKTNWTQEMDQVLLECLDADNEFRGKQGRSFASIARWVADKVGVPLSDKSVRDRVVYFRRTRGQSSQGGASKRSASQAQEAEEAAVAPVTTTDTDEGEQASTTSQPPEQAPATEEATRQRTAIIPGSKRRKL
ncbi:uncharacterized protein UDID_05339 [Ustilago sp. UG-2017a]|nr:uncharacterized protein UDID_05339 [Ustilago sp. UG-2017a]